MCCLGRQSLLSVLNGRVNCHCVLVCLHTWSENWRQEMRKTLLLFSMTWGLKALWTCSEISHCLVQKCTFLACHKWHQVLQKTVVFWGCAKGQLHIHTACQHTRNRLGKLHHVGQCSAHCCEMLPIFTQAIKRDEWHKTVLTNEVFTKLKAKIFRLYRPTH